MEHLGIKHILKSLPDGFYNGFPDEDREAVEAAVGGIVWLQEGENAVCHVEGMIEVEFDHAGSCHTIWIAPEHIEPI